MTLVGKMIGSAERNVNIFFSIRTDGVYDLDSLFRKDELRSLFWMEHLFELV